jgi:hypothetical protein
VKIERFLIRIASSGKFCGHQIRPFLSAGRRCGASGARVNLER